MRVGPTPQELLLLWPIARSDQKGTDVNVGELAA
jgi:hypothetical protein